MLYLIFLGNATHNFKIKYSDSLSLNYELVGSVSKLYLNPTVFKKNVDLIPDGKMDLFDRCCYGKTQTHRLFKSLIPELRQLLVVCPFCTILHSYEIFTCATQFINFFTIGYKIFIYDSLVLNCLKFNLQISIENSQFLN
jgi:hypothetical protein